MKLPELEITHASLWESPREPYESRPRFVSRYEVECCLTDGGASSIDDLRRELSRGLAIFARPGQIRHSRFPFRSYFIYFDSPPHPEFDALLSKIPEFSPPDELDETAILERLAMFERVREAFRGNRILATALLIELLSALASGERELHEPRMRPGQSEIFAAIGFMKQNLDRRLTVTEMAGVAGYSPPHFTARFRELVGKTPYEYFTGLRLTEAKRLLICEEIPVGEVAERLDFGSTSHFCALFKRSFGMTPTEFIQNGRMSDYEID